MAKKNQDLVRGPLFSNMIMFALPFMLSSVLQLLFNAADIVVVGRFAGSHCLAAVGSTSSITMLITNLFIGLSVGSNVVCAQYLGARDYENIHEAVHTSIAVSIVSGVGIGVFGFLLSRPLLELMGSPEDVIDLAVLYMKIIFCGMPATMVYNFGSALLRAKGDTKRPLYCLTLSGVLNVLLNLFFVIVLKIHVAGVALATIISQYVSSVLVLILLIKDPGVMHLNMKELKINKVIFAKIARIGIPSGLQGMTFSFSNVFIQSRINSFGSAMVAGSSAASNIEGFVYVLINGFSQAAVTFTSQNYGAGQYTRIKKINNLAMVMAAICGGIGGVVGYLFGPQLLSIYTSEAAVIEAGMIRMFFICLMHLLSVPMDVVTSTLRGMGYSMQPMLMSIFGVCVLRLLWLLFGFPFIPTIEAVYISYPVTWVVTGVAQYIFYLKVAKKFPKDVELA